MNKEYLLNEYKNRNIEYSLDIDSLNIISKMNEVLYHNNYTVQNDIEYKHPFIFSFGIPRSGTTLLSQVITSAFDIGYIDNIIARFWLAPEYGIELSKQLRDKNYNSNFKSDYAQTDIFEAHEFAYFWQFWLKKNKLKDFLIFDKEEQFDKIGFKNTMNNIMSSFNKPVAFKNILGANHINYLNNTLKKVLWVYIKREPIDVIFSILEAREKYYSDINQWWSSYPLEYEEIKDFNGYEQVVAQVYYLKKFYEEKVLKGQNNVIIIDYKDLSNDPIKFADTISSKLKKLFDYDIIKTYEKLPKKFTESKKSLEKYDFSKIKTYYKKYFKEELNV